MSRKNQKVLELDDEPRVKMEPGVEQQQQQQQQQQQAQGAVGGDSVVEALVVSNSRLWAQVVACDRRAFTDLERARVQLAACDRRAFTESERARVMEEQLTESKARNSVLEAEGGAKDADIGRFQSEASHLKAEITRLQLEMACRDAAQLSLEGLQSITGLGTAPATLAR